ncbi:hypothetical protein [Bradyrhizobium canariense]|uniref:hypothetical protein n=1 Tax=Bradyrhizobium canariense TaxID=255045 RepID=UPI001177FE6C|nr:hypothetical protein [Bradyrhizobium canariense]
MGLEPRCGLSLSEAQFFVEPYLAAQMFVCGGLVSIQSIVATILERELAARGVHSLRHSDCMEIVENLLVRLKELDQELAARNIGQS